MTTLPTVVVREMMNSDFSLFRHYRPVAGWATAPAAEAAFDLFHAPPIPVGIPSERDGPDRETDVWVLHVAAAFGIAEPATRTTPFNRTVAHRGDESRRSGYSL